MAEASFAERLARVYHTVRGDGEPLLSKLRRTCCDMLRDRGCERVEQHVEPDGPLNGRMLLVSGHDRPDGGPDVEVYISLEDRVGVRVARSLVDGNRAADRGVRLVVVSIDGPTVCTKKECERDIQFWLAKELCYNVTRHSLVPRHSVVGESDLPASCRVEQLPKMLDTDPVARYYDWPAGTLVRIQRVFGGSEEIPFFRCVCRAGV